MTIKCRYAFPVLVGRIKIATRYRGMCRARRKRETIWINCWQVVGNAVLLSVGRAQTTLTVVDLVAGRHRRCKRSVRSNLWRLINFKWNALFLVQIAVLRYDHFAAVLLRAGRERERKREMPQPHRLLDTDQTVWRRCNAKCLLGLLLCLYDMYTMACSVLPLADFYGPHPPPANWIRRRLVTSALGKCSK